MPVPPRCLFHQDTCSTKMPGFNRQDACSTTRCLGIVTGKMPVPPRCLFHQDAWF
ncbi:hypothetical protein [Moorena sp. SIO3H5]|uniref:hypothetical protein n=1 Tax=Moorena sp. SIO3H5 TaxID=2607834 RepID=UPI0013BCDB45|nr:hypothetical protein [Moorena sp. SIO3H5]NEO73897.1 hypothetical protein [Moorena sp. SIO3H5]